MNIQNLIYDGAFSFEDDNELLELLKEFHYPYNSLYNTFDIKYIKYISIWDTIANLNGYRMILSQKNNTLSFEKKFGEEVNKFVYQYNNGIIFCKSTQKPINGFINIDHDEIIVSFNREELHNINGELYTIDLNQPLYYKPFFFIKNSKLITKDKLPIKIIYPQWDEFLTEIEKKEMLSMKHFEKYF